MNFKLSKYIHILKDKELLPKSVILYGTRRGVVYELTNTQLDVLEKGDFALLPFDIIKTLIQTCIIIPTEENELQRILEENKASTKDSNTLSFTIQPTANCQLGCHYCGQVHTKKTMSVNVADLMIERIKQKIINEKSKFKSLNIAWYGGEPLTGLSSIEYSSFILQDLAEKNNLEYSAQMVTNGLALKEKLFQHLVIDHKVKHFQITLDGTAKVHDNRRMLKNGSPSFDIIFNNICTIALSDFYAQTGARIAIRCNVSSENRDNVFELMNLLKENNIHNKVIFSLARVTDWGDNEAGTKKKGGISKEEFAQLEIEVILKQIAENFQLTPKNIIPQRRTNPCMVTNENTEVFDGFGNVSTCWEVPYTPYFNNEKFVAGNLVKNSNIDTSNVAMRKWFDEIPTNESWCKSCKFLPVCGGSCPKEWYQGIPACPSFKFNIDERLLMKKFKIVD